MGYAAPVRRRSPVLDSVFHSYWAVADEGIYFVDFADVAKPNAPKPIKFLHLKTRQIKPIAAIQEEVERPVPGFSVSKDGRQIFWAQIDRVDSDLMMIDNFR
jgi:hypothetical protein